MVTRKVLSLSIAATMIKRSHQKSPKIERPIIHNSIGYVLIITIITIVSLLNAKEYISLVIVYTELIHSLHYQTEYKFNNLHAYLL